MAHIKYLALVFLLASVVCGAVDDPEKESPEQPHFDSNSKSEIKAVSGRSAYLVCKVHNIGNKTVSWIRHKDLAILSSGQETYADDNRFALYHKPGSGEWVLKIKFVRTNDAGVYECQLPTIPPIGFAINLDVIVPETQIIGGKEFFVDFGSTLNLTCTVSNSPEHPQYIFWYHNESAMDFRSSGRVSISIEKDDVTTSFLAVTRVVASDSGTYSCSPSNSDPAKVKVHVLKVEIPAAMQTNVSGKKACGTPIQIMMGMVAALLCMI